MRSDLESVLMVVFANAAAIAVALWQRWPLNLLLWTYWLQSVVIGWYSGRRILALQRFSTEGTSGFTGGSDEEIKRNTVKIFAAHYGIFHFVYMFFLFIFQTTGKAPEMTGTDAAWILALGAMFALTHRASFKRNLENDMRGRPNIGTLMFLPYARVVPMHLTFIFGIQMGFTGALLLFSSLKTAADVLMHVVEHRILAKPAPPGPGGKMDS